MRIKALWLLLLILTPLLFSECATAAPPDDKLSAQLAAAQSQVTALQAQLDRSKVDSQASDADKAKLQTQIASTQAQVSQLQEQITKLKQDNQLTGSTLTETAQKIVKLYHDTHVYDSYDLFVCGDMAQEVWNMLKAQNISAKIQIGKVEGTPAKEMIDSDHAWILAEVAPGSYLALETTAGYSVSQKDNSLYYQGWSFQSPRDYKQYADLLNEYNLRVALANDLTARYNQTAAGLTQANTTYNQMVDTFNKQYAGKPSSAESKSYEDKMNAQLMVVKEKDGRAAQAKEEYERQKALLPPLLTKMKGLVR